MGTIGIVDATGAETGSSEAGSTETGSTETGSAETDSIETGSFLASGFFSTASSFTFLARMANSPWLETTFVPIEPTLESAATMIIGVFEATPRSKMSSGPSTG